MSTEPVPTPAEQEEAATTEKAKTAGTKLSIAFNPDGDEDFDGDAWLEKRRLKRLNRKRRISL